VTESLFKTIKNEQVYLCECGMFDEVLARVANFFE